MARIFNIGLKQRGATMKKDVMPGFSAEAAVYLKRDDYSLRSIRHSDRTRVVPAQHRFTILTEGHTGYCCNCDSSLQSCACEPCFSV
jgi:hypothetical protein